MDENLQTGIFSVRFNTFESLRTPPNGAKGVGSAMQDLHRVHFFQGAGSSSRGEI
jgi:hypothetical protein